MCRTWSGIDSGSLTNYLSMDSEINSEWQYLFINALIDTQRFQYHPPAGGRFYFDFALENNTTGCFLIDTWIEIVTPAGISFPVLQRGGLNLPGGTVIDKQDLCQSVPSTAEPGEYTYRSHARDVITWEILAVDSFTFDKEYGDSLNLIIATGNYPFGAFFNLQKHRYHPLISACIPPALTRSMLQRLSVSHSRTGALCP